MQVVIEQAGQCRLPFLLGVLGRGQVASVGAEQVMHVIAVRSRLLDQVRPGEQVQQRAYLPEGGAGERGGCVTVEVGAGVQAQQPESAGRRRGQVPVGPREHRPHPGPRISVSIQQVQPQLLICQLTGQVGQGHVRMRGGELSGYAQCQRQPRALRGQHLSRGGVGVDSPANQRSQQGDRIGHWQQVQVQARGAVPGHQPCQRIAAGHQHATGRRARQQRPHLLGRAGVVQHHQYPPPGEHAPV